MNPGLVYRRQRVRHQDCPTPGGDDRPYVGNFAITHHDKLFGLYLQAAKQSQVGVRGFLAQDRDGLEQAGEPRARDLVSWLRRSPFVTSARR